MHIEVKLVGAKGGGKTHMGDLIAALIREHAAGSVTYEIRTQLPGANSVIEHKGRT